MGLPGFLTRAWNATKNFFKRRRSRQVVALTCAVCFAVPNAIIYFFYDKDLTSLIIGKENEQLLFIVDVSLASTLGVFTLKSFYYLNRDQLGVVVRTSQVGSNNGRNCLLRACCGTKDVALQGIELVLSSYKAVGRGNSIRLLMKSISNNTGNDVALILFTTTGCIFGVAIFFANVAIFSYGKRGVRIPGAEKLSLIFGTMYGISSATLYGGDIFRLVLASDMNILIKGFSLAGTVIAGSGLAYADARGYSDKILLKIGGEQPITVRASQTRCLTRFNPATDGIGEFSYAASTSQKMYAVLRPVVPLGGIVPICIVVAGGVAVSIRGTYYRMPADSQLTARLLAEQAASQADTHGRVAATGVAVRAPAPQSSTPYYQQSPKAGPSPPVAQHAVWNQANTR